MSDQTETLVGLLRALIARQSPDEAETLVDSFTAPLPEHERRTVRLLIFGPGSQVGDVAVGDIAGNSLNKAALHLTGGQQVAPIGINYGPLHINIGTQVTWDVQDRIRDYLDSLVSHNDKLRLNRLLGKELSGSEEVTVPVLPLRSVYTRLSTTSWFAGDTFTLPKQEVISLIEASNPAKVLPNKVCIAAIGVPGESSEMTFRQRYALDAQGVAISDIWFRALQDVAGERSSTLTGQWYYPESPSRALRTHTHIVLLGAPGSGKSTVLRYLAVEHAHQLLSGKQLARETPLPFYCQLGRVAQELTDNPKQDYQILTNALLRPLASLGTLNKDVQDIVGRIIERGEAILCFDGLDEVSGTPPKRGSRLPSHRHRIADTLRKLAQRLPRTKIIVTCRIKPYHQMADWQLRDDWTMRTLAPLSFGQIRHFLSAWYTQTCSLAKSHSQAEALRRASHLSTTLESRKQLSQITTSPLLLTMLALLDYNNKHLPEKRVAVYEELVQLLLDRWESLRSEDNRPRQSISERLELQGIGSEEIRRVVHELAYEAHRGAVDGRGVLGKELLYHHLDAFFARHIDPENPRRVLPEEVAQRRGVFEQLLRDESGLIQEEDDGKFVLPHLTFQEYLCACHLAKTEKPSVVYQHWAESADRWREVIMLLMGRLLHHDKYLMAYGWLQTLLNRHIDSSPDKGGRRPKSLEQRQRDALFASDCYRELGRQAHLSGHGFDIDELEMKLRDALIDSIQQPSPALILENRIDIAHQLVTLGDMRFPVGVAAWAESVRQCMVSSAATSIAANTGVIEPYWCPVAKGTYAIGGWQTNHPRTSIKLHSFWIARFPVTVSQFAEFVEVGYGPEGRQWWTPLGQQWLDKHAPHEPWNWLQPPYDVPNQPVVGVNWYEATAFACWLRGHLGKTLPRGYTIRLPTEAEWEAAALSTGEQRHPYPWGAAAISPARAIYEAAQLGRPAPVGCCPEGRSRWGAHDMVGNVWEMTSSSFKAYPTRSHELLPDVSHDGFDVAWRGGNWESLATDASVATRSGAHLHIVHGVGFRLVLAPV